MKPFILCAASLALLAGPLDAQTTPAAPPATAAARLTLDTPIETIAATPAGKAVLDADFPGLTTHPMYESFKGMSLAALQAMARGKITDAQLAKAKADLAAIK